MSKVTTQAARKPATRKPATRTVAKPATRKPAIVAVQVAPEPIVIPVAPLTAGQKAIATKRANGMDFSAVARKAHATRRANKLAAEQAARLPVSAPRRGFFARLFGFGQSATA